LEVFHSIYPFKTFKYTINASVEKLGYKNRFQFVVVYIKCNNSCGDKTNFVSKAVLRHIIGFEALCCKSYFWKIKAKGTVIFCVRKKLIELSRFQEYKL